MVRTREILPIDGHERKFSPKMEKSLVRDIYDKIFDNDPTLGDKPLSVRVPIGYKELFVILYSTPTKNSASEVGLASISRGEGKKKGLIFNFSPNTDNPPPKDEDAPLYFDISF